MISDNEFIEIIRGLQEKTSKDTNVPWQPKHPGDGTFFLQLPSSVISLQRVEPKAEPDFIISVLARGLGGRVLATRKVYEGDVGWDTLFDLYALISRKASGWENVWKNVQKFIGKANTVGAS